MNDVNGQYVDCGVCADYNDPEVRVQVRSWEAWEDRSSLFWGMVAACTEARCSGMVDDGVWNVVGGEVQRQQ